MSASQAERRGFDPRLPLHNLFRFLLVRRNPLVGEIRGDAADDTLPSCERFEHVEEFFCGRYRFLVGRVAGLVDALRVVLDADDLFVHVGEGGVVP